MPTSKNTTLKSDKASLKIPKLKLKDQFGEEHELLQLMAKENRTVLYFYPRDMTPGCTQESCDFRDDISAFKKLDTQVIGVSADTVATHQKFVEKYSLPFLLLSDPDKKLLEKVGVWQKKKFMGRSFMGIVRSTMVVNKEGKVLKLWQPVAVKGHVKEVESYLKEGNA